MSERHLELEDALDAATDDRALRRTALTLAVSHFRKINFTGDPAKLVGLADAFYRFLKG